MKKIILVIILVILVAAIILVGINVNFTGEVVSEFENKYTYTKAVCNDTKYCQDYEIDCEGQELVDMRPIIGAFVQHGQNWNDARENKEEFCNQ